MLLLKVQLIQNIFNLALFKRNQLTKFFFQIVIDKYNQHTRTILYLLWIYISRYKLSPHSHCLRIIGEKLYVTFMHTESSSKSIFKYKQRNSFVHFLNIRIPLHKNVNTRDLGVQFGLVYNCNLTRLRRDIHTKYSKRLNITIKTNINYKSNE